MKEVVICSILACLLSACGGVQGPSSPVNPVSREHPYGLWSTERGQTIEVMRDGTYSYCDERTCERGTTRPSGVTNVYLDGFGKMAGTKRLRTLSDWDTHPGVNYPGSEVAEGWLDFGDGAMDTETRRELCGTRPCRIVGRVDYDVYRFIKLKDY